MMLGTLAKAGTKKGNRAQLVNSNSNRNKSALPNSITTPESSPNSSATTPHVQLDDMESGKANEKIQGAVSGGVIQETDEDEEMKKAARHILFAAIVTIFGYLSVGTLTFSLVEKWSFVDALYFSTVTLTTVGYGDQAAWTSDNIRVFTSLYALFGIMLIGTALGVVGAQIVEENEKSLDRAKKAALKTKAIAKGGSKVSLRKTFIPKFVRDRVKISPRVEKLLPGFASLIICILVGSIFIKLDSNELSAAGEWEWDHNPSNILQF